MQCRSPSRAQFRFKNYLLTFWTVSFIKLDLYYMSQSKLETKKSKFNFTCTRSN